MKVEMEIDTDSLPEESITVIMKTRGKIYAKGYKYIESDEPLTEKAVEYFGQRIAKNLVQSIVKIIEG